MKPVIKNNNNLKLTSISQVYNQIKPLKGKVRDYKVIAITVSVNYSDYLRTIIDNAKQLERWFIITSAEDIDTINLIKNSGYDNISIIFFNFKSFGVFNKGGGLKVGQIEAQKYLIKNVGINQLRDYYFLILDSDISLPDNFREQLSYYQLQTNTVYGSYRTDYHSLSDFQEEKNPQKYPAWICGYFQMYSPIQGERYIYQDSWDCGGCDNIFRDLFKNKELLEVNVKHIGIPEVNWKGRRSESLK